MNSLDNYLAHYGIKGQTWGIRRYQNEDGTLTEEGKLRYGTADNITDDEKFRINYEKKMANAYKWADNRAEKRNKKASEKVLERMKKNSEEGRDDASDKTLAKLKKKAARLKNNKEYLDSEIEANRKDIKTANITALKREAALNGLSSVLSRLSGNIAYISQNPNTNSPYMTNALSGYTSDGRRRRELYNSIKKNRDDS